MLIKYNNIWKSWTNYLKIAYLIQRLNDLCRKSSLRHLLSHLPYWASMLKLVAISAIMGSWKLTRIEHTWKNLALMWQNCCGIIFFILSLTCSTWILDLAIFTQTWTFILGVRRNVRCTPDGRREIIVKPLSAKTYISRRELVQHFIVVDNGYIWSAAWIQFTDINYSTIRSY